MKEDKALRIGSAHGSERVEDEVSGYARDIAPQERAPAGGATKNRTGEAKSHPSRRLDLRAHGYGIGGGYERAYKRERPRSADDRKEIYGPLPHAGYYGAGSAMRPFKIGQAGFREEIDWYRRQYGEKTSGYCDDGK